jgi:hypothetical protein
LSTVIDETRRSTADQISVIQADVGIASAIQSPHQQGPATWQHRGNASERQIYAADGSDSFATNVRFGFSGHSRRKKSCPLYPESGHVRCKRKCPLWANSGHSVPSRFLRCSSSSRLWKIIGPSYISVARARPAPVPIPSDGLFRAGDRSRPFAMVSLMSHRRRRVLVDTPKGRRSAGFTVPESAAAADVSMALRRRGWSPYALRLDPEQHAWIALVMDWRRAA